jgi:adenine-specific DNA-methyltransferase
MNDRQYLLPIEYPEPSLADTLDGENSAYLTEQLITYIGNKRSLLRFIETAVHRVQEELRKERLDILDIFSGSGVVARFFKRFAERLIVNDLERYSEIANRCYLANVSEIDMETLRQIHADLSGRLEKGPLVPGIISTHYAPRDDRRIRPGERVFYTTRNARYLDTARRRISDVPEQMRHFLLAPLISEASVHANTSGVFKGFYKDADTGVGKFGGSNGDALTRITGEITIPFPIFSRYECPVIVHRSDANSLAPNLPTIDLAYLDPPYNQHPYGSNYFMLNLLADYREPGATSDVSGIPADWNRSNYNKAGRAAGSFESLVREIPARFLLVSFNSEGFIEKETMLRILRRVGSVEVMETRYNTYRGSRNLRNRNIHVKEYLYLVKKEAI